MSIFFLKNESKSAWRTRLLPIPSKAQPIQTTHGAIQNTFPIFTFKKKKFRKKKV